MSLNSWRDKLQACTFYLFHFIPPLEAKSFSAAEISLYLRNSAGRADILLQYI